MKERIINTARERFFQFGFRKVTMDEIASDLGISKKTLYKYFDSKESLAAEVVAEFQSNVAKMINTLRAEVSDPIERFEKCILEVSQRRSKVSNLFLADIKKDMPRLWKTIEEFREKTILDHMGDILQEGIKKGKIRKDINPKIATNIYLGSIQTIMQPDRLARNEYSIEEAFSNISKIFLRGVEVEQIKQ